MQMHKKPIPKKTLSPLGRHFLFSCTITSLLTVLVITSCASVETRTSPKSATRTQLVKPDKLLIYDFAVSPQEIQLDEGISRDISELVKGTEGTPKSQMEMEVGRKVARALSENLVQKLGAYGILARRATRIPSPEENVHMVQGHFLSIDEGNATQRMVIGFGVGRSVVRVHGQVYKMTPEGKTLLGEFDSEVKSGRKPGVGPMAGVGAAAGTAATAVVMGTGIGVTSEIADALPFSASLEANVEKMAKDLAERAARFHVKQGWLPAEVLK